MHFCWSATFFVRIVGLCASFHPLLLLFFPRGQLVCDIKLALQMKITLINRKYRKAQNYQTELFSGGSFFNYFYLTAQFPKRKYLTKSKLFVYFRLLLLFCVLENSHFPLKTTHFGGSSPFPMTPLVAFHVARHSFCRFPFLHPQSPRNLIDLKIILFSFHLFLSFQAARRLNLFYYVELSCLFPLSSPFFHSLAAYSYHSTLALALAPYHNTNTRSVPECCVFHANL